MAGIEESTSPRDAFKGIQDFEKWARSCLPEDLRNRAVIGPVNLGEIEVGNRTFLVTYGSTNFQLRSLVESGQPHSFGRTYDRVVSVVEQIQGSTVFRSLAYEMDVRELPSGVANNLLDHLDSVRAGRVSPSGEIIRSRVIRSAPGAISY